MSEEDSSDGTSREEPRRYPLQWNEGMRPDEEDLLIETVGDEE